MSRPLPSNASPYFHWSTNKSSITRSTSQSTYNSTSSSNANVHSNSRAQRVDLKVARVVPASKRKQSWIEIAKTVFDTDLLVQDPGNKDTEYDRKCFFFQTL